MSNNIIKALDEEIKRCGEILDKYKKIPQATFVATMLKAEIKKAKEAIFEIDTTQMILSIEELRKYN